MLYNNTGVCRDSCQEGETGIFISHLGDRYMDLRVYNKDGNVTVENNVPVEDVRLQVPCMWQLTGKPNCCGEFLFQSIGCYFGLFSPRTFNAVAYVMVVSLKVLANCKEFHNFSKKSL